MSHGTERLSDPRCGLELGAMSLPVIDAQRKAFETLVACDRQRRGRIEPAGDKHNSTFFVIAHDRLQRSAKAAGSTSWRIAPEILVELNLKSDRQPLIENPLCELPRFELPCARAEQHGATFVKATVEHELTCPIEIRTIANDELDMLFGAQHFQVIETIACDLAAARCFDVNDTHDARINLRDVHRAARLERDAVTSVAQTH